MNHSLQVHVDSLDQLCRLCGMKNATKVNKKHRVGPKLCKDLSVDILLVFGVNVGNDRPHCHPKHICKTCELTIKNIKRTNSVFSLQKAQATADECSNLWKQYDNATEFSNCVVCNRVRVLQDGCFRRGKHTNSGDSIQMSGLDQLVDIETDQPGPSRLINDCSLDLDIDTFDASEHLASSTPKKQTVRQTSCSTTSPMIKAMYSILDILEAPIDKPLNKIEQKVATYLIKRKLTTETDEKDLDLIRCKTGGQPLILKRLTRPRKDTSLARTPTKKRRARCIQNVRRKLAGETQHDTDSQLTTELKKIPRVRRHGICKKAGIKDKIKISKQHTLAMKEALGLSWRQDRTYRQYLLKTVGASLENEKAVRNLHHPRG